MSERMSCVEGITVCYQLCVIHAQCVVFRESRNTGLIAKLCDAHRATCSSFSNAKVRLRK